MASFQYYTKEQADTLHRLRDLAGGYEFDREWRELISDIKVQMVQDPNPQNPRAPMLVVRWQQLVKRFTGGSAEIEALLYDATSKWHQHESGEGRAVPNVLSYIQRAIAASRDG